MTAARSAFDRELDALLSKAADPVVAPDLARRIVVRTAHLPQEPAAEPEGPVRQPQPVAPQAWGPRWPKIVRRGRVAQFAGGAIAACLLAVIVTGQQSTTGAPHSPGGEATAGVVVASVEQDDLPDAEPVAPRSAEPGRQVQLASGEQPLREEATGAAPSPAGDEKPVVEVESEPVQLAEGSERSPLKSSAIQGFKLAGSDEDGAQVYGPVLQPERRHSFGGHLAGDGVALGVAGGGRAASSSGLGW